MSMPDSPPPRSGAPTCAESSSRPSRPTAGASRIRTRWVRARDTSRNGEDERTRRCAARLVIRKTQCRTCIYRPDSPLDLEQLENQVRDTVGKTVCCRGFWNRHAGDFPADQLATARTWCSPSTTAAPWNTCGNGLTGSVATCTPNERRARPTAAGTRVCLHRIHGPEGRTNRGRRKPEYREEEATGARESRPDRGKAHEIRPKHEPGTHRR